MEPKFYVCPICGNVITKVVSSSVIPICCGREMQLLVPHTEEHHASEPPIDPTRESHLPIVTQTDDYSLLIRVGATPHPMTEDHHIKFIYLETEHGGQIHYFTHSDRRAEVSFCCTKDQPVAVYTYCNIHGLWRTDAFYERHGGFFSCCRRGRK